MYAIFLWKIHSFCGACWLEQYDLTLHVAQVPGSAFLTVSIPFHKENGIFKYCDLEAFVVILLGNLHGARPHLCG